MTADSSGREPQLRYGIPTRQSTKSLAEIPRQVAFAKTVATHLQGKSFLYKDKSYLGPIQVEFASSSYRWIQVSFVTQPWHRQQAQRRYTLVTPVRGVSANAFSICLNAGYGINGIFIHASAAIGEIRQLYETGASFQDLIYAFNTGRGLSELTASLLRHPFAPQLKSDKRRALKNRR